MELSVGHGHSPEAMHTRCPAREHGVLIQLMCLGTSSLRQGGNKKRKSWIQQPHSYTS